MGTHKPQPENKPVTTLTHQVAFENYQGPLPHPRHLQQYEAVAPRIGKENYCHGWGAGKTPPVLGKRSYHVEYQK